MGGGGGNQGQMPMAGAGGIQMRPMPQQPQSMMQPSFGSTYAGAPMPQVGSNPYTGVPQGIGSAPAGMMGLGAMPGAVGQPGFGVVGAQAPGDVSRPMMGQQMRFNPALLQTLMQRYRGGM